MNLANLEIALKAAMAAHDRAFFQLRGLMNDSAAADMNTVRLNLVDAIVCSAALMDTPA